MIEAAQFVEAARRRGFTRYAGVPCSFLTPFINYVIQDATLAYASCANEGDAVALNAGATLAGARAVTMMQNSGLGNAVSPLTSLTWTFRLPQLLIVTWRGQPGVPDEPQHALMGPITPTLLDSMEIAWELFPQDAAEIDAVLDRAMAHMDNTGLPYALVMRKGSVAPYALGGAGAAAVRGAGASAVRGAGASPLQGTRAEDTRPTRADALRRVLARTAPGNTVVIGTTGYTGRELYALDDRPNHFYMVGSMGCTALLALGLAQVRPDLRVIALDGDGAALMRLSAFTTLGTYGPPNLFHVVLDNGMHESTGGQATVSGGVSFAAVAAACGYALALEGEDLAVVDKLFDTPAGDGARFAALRIRPGSPADLPRPTVSPVQVRQRLARHLGAPGQPSGEP